MIRKRGKRNRIIISQCYFQILVLIISLVAFAVLMSDGVGGVKGDVSALQALLHRNSNLNEVDNTEAVQDSPSVAPLPAAAAGLSKVVPSTVGETGYSLVTISGKSYLVEGEAVVGKTYTNIVSTSGERIASLEIGNDAKMGAATKAQTDAAGLTAKGTASETGSYLSDLFKAAPGGYADALWSGLQWAAVVYFAVKYIGPMLGLSEETSNALAAAAAAGLGVYKILDTYTGFNEGIGGWMHANAGIVGLGAGVLIFLMMYKKTNEQIVKFECKPYQAPVGGEDCELCNKDDMKPCTEYRCKSLGQDCGIVNAGTKQEKCIWLNPHDVKAPVITAWETPLTKGYKYEPQRSSLPPNYGVEVVTAIINPENSNGCVEAFTPLSFGITTDEPSQCKIDYNHTIKYGDMKFFFGETNLYLINHTEKLSLPSPKALEAQSPEIKTDGIYNLYVRCQDANGNGGEKQSNANVAEFVFRFCVNDGPDNTPPQIQGTNPINNMPFNYNRTSMPAEFYVNEPSECKWSREDKDYENMENTMTDCGDIFNINANLVYTCKTTLTGLKNREDNTFYVRCKDQPSAEEGLRNVNQESYIYTLKGTQPLNLVSIGPSGTVKAATDPVPVYLTAETANGYKDGEATCYYSRTGAENDYIQFFDTGKDVSTQRQDLSAGNYKYYFKCIDLGGNADTNSTSFKVEVDKREPAIIRAYKEGDVLIIMTDENSECSYSTSSRNFEFAKGIEMPYKDEKKHTAKWNTDFTYYIKCKDAFGNEPLPTQCSAVVKAYEILKQKS